MATVKVVEQPTLRELRAIQFEQIQLIREGKTTAATLNAIANGFGKIVQSVKVEMEYCKLVGKAPSLAGLLEQGEPQEQQTTDNNVSEFKKQTA